MGYKIRALKGVTWITLLRGLTRIITFVRLAVLGRLLTPTQFGYYGLASLLLSLLEILTETGINIFLVQEKGSIKEYINSAWVVSIIRGVLLSLVILISAPFLATYFESPEAYSVIALIAIVPFIRGFINPAIIIYQKDLLFQKEFLLRTTLFFIDVVVSIIFGFITKNATAFVYGIIASTIVEVFLSYILLSDWPRFRIEIKKVKHVIARGWWVTLSGIFSYFADNGDNLVVGKVLGSASLGIYQVAYKFSTLPISEITIVVNQVIFPVYSKFSDDRKRLWNAFVKVTISNFFGALILGGIIYFFAEPILLFFMGNQWVAAVPAVQVLAIFGIIRTIFGSFSALFLSVGKQNYVAWMTFARTFILLIAVVPLVTQFGMVGAAWAMLFSAFAEIPIIIYFTSKIFNKKQ